MIPPFQSVDCYKHADYAILPGHALGGCCKQMPVQRSHRMQNVRTVMLFPEPYLGKLEKKHYVSSRWNDMKYFYTSSVIFGKFSGNKIAEIRKIYEVQSYIELCAQTQLSSHQRQAWTEPTRCPKSRHVFASIQGCTRGAYTCSQGRRRGQEHTNLSWCMKQIQRNSEAYEGSIYRHSSAALFLCMCCMHPQR